MIGMNRGEKAPSWSCESEGSGEILDEGIVSCGRCSLTSSGYNLELLNWQMEVSKSIEKRGLLIVANVY